VAKQGSVYDAAVASVADRVHRLLRPQETVGEDGRFMDREAAAQAHAGIGFLERGSNERDRVEEDVAKLEDRARHLEDIVEQAVAELDHYADNSTDPEMIDKVSDLVEVLRKTDESRHTARREEAQA
jgi:hypothetical protein